MSWDNFREAHYLPDTLGRIPLSYAPTTLVLCTFVTCQFLEITESYPFRGIQISKRLTSNKSKC
jgi:hypothetical protein